MWIKDKYHRKYEVVDVHLIEAGDEDKANGIKWVEKENGFKKAAESASHFGDAVNYCQGGYVGNGEVKNIHFIKTDLNEAQQHYQKFMNQLFNNI